MSHVDDTPTVARVLLVAHPSRQRELEGWLRVRGEGARYELRLAAVDAIAFDERWDVVVLDGESLFDERARREVMRRFGERPREASVIFVCSRLPHEAELADAAAWADDFVYSGWVQAERVRSRVQLVALAPWRRAAALRRRAERAGDERLRVLPGCAPELGVERLAPIRLGCGRRFTSVQARIASDAFDEGRRVALVELAEQVNRICAEALERVAEGRACPEAARNVEETYRGVPSPVVAARFGGASAAVEAVWGSLRQLVREELAALGPARAGGS